MNIINILKPKSREIQSEQERKSYLMYFFSYVSIFASLLFAIMEFNNEGPIYSIIILSFFLITLANLIYYRISNKLELCASIIIFLFGILELLIFTRIGAGITGLLWYCVFPVAAVALLDNKTGTIFSILLLVLSLFLHIYGVNIDLVINYYNSHTILRLFLIYSVILALINFIEYSRKKAYQVYIKTLAEIKNKSNELYNAKEEVAYSESKFRELFEKSGDAILIWQNGKITDCNLALLDMLGYNTKDEIQNLKISNISSKFQKNGESSIKKSKNMIKIAIRNKSHRFEWMHLTSDGKEFPTEVLLTVISNTSENTIIHAVIKDITLQKLAERQLVKLSTAVEQNPATIVITDTKGCIEYVNPRFTNLTGFSQKDTIGKTPRILKSTKTDPEIYKELWETISSGGIWKGEFINRKKDGQEFYEKATIAPIKNDYGEIVNYIAIKEDITEYKKTEQELKEVDSNYKEILDANTDVVFIINKFGKQLYFNKQVEIMLGYNPDDVIGKLFTTFVPKSEIPKFLLKLKEVFLTKYVSGFETFAIHNNGTLVPIELTGRIIKYKGETVAVGTIRSLVERKRAEKELLKSETKYKELIHNQGEGYAIVDMNEEFVFANPAAAEIFGVMGDELVGTNLKKFLSDAQYQIIKNETKERKKGTASTYDLEIIREDKQKRNIIITSTPKYDSNDEVIETMSIFRDITDRKKVEQGLIESEERFKALSEATYEAILISNKGYCIDANEAASKLYGYKHNEFIGRFATDFIAPESKDLVKTNMLSGYEIPYQAIAQRKDGSKFDVELQGRMFKYRGGTVRVTAARNITDRLKAEKELVIAKLDADKANRLKSEFLANMSHEIRTPMNAVLGFAEILKEKLKGKNEYKSFMDGIINGGENLIALINDILDLSKIEAGRMDIKPEAVDLAKLIYDIKQLFSVETKAKDIKVSLEIDSNLPVTILLDKTRIRQILFNLVGNAVKFTEKGSIIISVRIGGGVKTSEQTDLYIEIKDSGLGIPDDELDSIFEAFQQAKGQSDNYGGTGLGLPITKKLVEAMHGEITANSVVGKGSVFLIHLKKVVIPKIQGADSSNSEHILIEDIKFNKPNILLVEDIQSNREIVSFQLKFHNCNVFEVENGQEAIDYLKSNTPDLILMDMQMPVLNGFEATKIIRSKGIYNTIPIIALTAIALNEQSKQLKNIFDDYLKKPLTKNDLVRSLMKFLPYQGIDNEDCMIEDTFCYINELNIEFERIGKLPEQFLEFFKIEIYPLYEEVNEILDIDECKEFASKLINSGTKYHINTFVKFGKELMTYTDSFQLGEIERLLGIFNDMIDGIKKIKGI